MVDPQRHLLDMTCSAWPQAPATNSWKQCYDFISIEPLALSSLLCLACIRNSFYAEGRASLTLHGSVTSFSIRINFVLPVPFKRHEHETKWSIWYFAFFCAADSNSWWSDDFKKLFDVCRILLRQLLEVLSICSSIPVPRRIWVPIILPKLPI